MSGTKAGGKKAAETNKTRNGIDFYKRIGAIGGRKGKTGGFASQEKGKDGLTGAERARIAGKKGGMISSKNENKAPIEERRSEIAKRLKEKEL